MKNEESYARLCRIERGFSVDIVIGSKQGMLYFV